MSKHKKKREGDQSCYAVYRGDEFIDLGTLEELSKSLGILKRTLQFMKSPSYKKRMKNYEKFMIIYKIEEDGERV